MKTAPTLTSVLTYFALLAASMSIAGAARIDQTQRAIEAQAKVFMAALGNGDAPGAAQVFTAEAKLSVPAMGIIEGRPAIAEFWRGALVSGLKALELSKTDLEGEGDLRVETGTYRLFAANRAEAGRGQYLLVWKKEDGAWKIHRDFGHADTPTPAMPPAASTQSDRVGFPVDYRTAFKLLAVNARPDGSEIMTTYVNPLAAAVEETGQLPYPHGSVFVMEFAAPFRDGEGQLLRDSAGKLIKGEVAHVDVMRRGDGFGEGYGASRAGEWEFASYGRDGKTLIAPANAGHCAACHGMRAGVEKDYVFRSRPKS
jgi:ketosteroid isomerase-like protein